MTISLPISPPTSRLIALDFTKGISVISMAFIHCAFFFSQWILFIPFKVFDPFVFSTFLLCFGVGNGLSKKPKKLGVLGQLLLLYGVGGLPSAIVAEHFLQPRSSLAEIASQQWIQAITLQKGLSYADFLESFIVCYAFFWLIQKWFRELNWKTIAITLSFSIIFYMTGENLPYFMSNSFADSLYNQGFRDLQNVPIFLSGVCLGLGVRKYGFPRLNSVQLKVAILAFFGLLFGSFWLFQSRSLPSETAVLWKQSGDFSYLVIGTIVPILMLWILETLLHQPNFKLRGGAIQDAVICMGRETMKGLWIQFLMLPIVGYLVTAYLPKMVHLPCAVATLCVIAGLTCPDRLNMSFSKSNVGTK